VSGPHDFAVRNERKRKKNFAHEIGLATLFGRAARRRAESPLAAWSDLRESTIRRFRKGPPGQQRGCHRHALEAAGVNIIDGSQPGSRPMRWARHIRAADVREPPREETAHDGPSRHTAPADSVCKPCTHKPIGVM
jgi:hypothetical protein